MPPDVMKRLIKRDITGKTGAERVRVLREALDSLPGYYTGAFGKLRQWINQEIAATGLRAKVPARQSFNVPKQGHRQVAVVGPPNAGKSALLKALSGAQIRVAEYPFATLKPQAALVNVGGAWLQFVEIPGLLPGASEDRGGGKALLGAVRTADIVLYLSGLGQDPLELDLVRREVAAAGIERPEATCLTGLDLPGAREAAPARLAAAGRAVACSTITGEGLDELRAMVWAMAGLVRVWRRGERGEGGEPFVLDEGATIGDLARGVHKELSGVALKAVVWGPSARFPGQVVGPGHVLADGDEIELKVRA